MERPEGIVDFTPSPELFPFESRWYDSSAGPMHYIDEGAGPPLLLLHGNPDWGFLYRHIVLGLRDRFRCIVPDYPGFGLSINPVPGYGYSPAQHATVVRELVTELDLGEAVVMGQDWGGPIGMDAASRMPDRFRGLVMGNTWFWPADARTLNLFSLSMGSPPMQWLIRERNFFVTTLMKRTVQAQLTDREWEHYTAVVPTPAHRAGIAFFPKAIRQTKPWMTQLETRSRSNLRDKPMVLFRGAKDPALGTTAVRDRWLQTFPDATVVELPDAGHYIQEDAPEVIIKAIAGAYAATG
jgi:haloalkane dehalogenase